MFKKIPLFETDRDVAEILAKKSLPPVANWPEKLETQIQVLKASGKEPLGWCDIKLWFWPEMQMFCGLLIPRTDVRIVVSKAQMGDGTQFWTVMIKALETEHTFVHFSDTDAHERMCD